MSGSKPTNLSGATSSTDGTATVSDEALVGAVRAGDDGAFEILFDRHKRRVARIASRFFFIREQVEDVLQESFIKAYFGLAEFAGRREQSFTAWITRIAINVCYDELRKHRRRPESSLAEFHEDDDAGLEARFRALAATDDIESAAVSRDLAMKLLSRLSADDRLVLTLLDAGEFSVVEIAEATGWSVSKVKVRAHRARAHLRKLLKKYL